MYSPYCSAEDCKMAMETWQGGLRERLELVESESGAGAWHAVADGVMRCMQVPNE